MDEPERGERLREFERTCREQGIPRTIQRRLILEAVLQGDDHPTANQVLEALSGRSRGISRATIHRTLDTLVRLGVITKACHPGNVIRYDARMEVHHHLVCTRCEKVFDIYDERLNALELPDTSAHDFQVKDFRVQIRGLCKQCRRLEGRPESE